MIDAQGSVRCPFVLKGLPMGLSEVAAETVSRWKFKPATLNGQPVAVTYNITLNFRLGS
jgi:outer membrane biosynthesis protein TonB